MAMPSADTDELARFGCKQELDRHRYFRWGALNVTGPLVLIGAVCYLAKLRGRPAAVLAEHRAGPGPAAVGAADEPA